MRNATGGRKSASGFTLLELMITVAVVAILATIAYASYQDQIIKSRRAAGAACLQERAQFMERFYTTNLSYLSSTGAAPNIPQCDSEVSPHYQVGLEAGQTTARSFVLQAVPQGMQLSRDTKCGTLTLTAQGVRGASGSASATPQDCW